MPHSTNQNQVIPIKKEDRIEFLDVLRGIAILFIFLANIVHFSGLFIFPIENQIPATTLFTDDYFSATMFTLVDGKFYSIFSLLFGIGCVMQYSNLKKHKKPFAPFFARRMFWLLLIGFVHLYFFWIGDILTLYALLGFILIGFVKLSDKKLLLFATIFILFPIVNWLVIHYSNLNYVNYFYDLSTAAYLKNGFPIVEWNGQTFSDFAFFLSNESVVDFFKLNNSNIYIRIGSIFEEGRTFKVFGIFLIGIWAGRKIINDDLLNQLPLLKKIAIWGIGVGLPISTYRTYIDFYVTGNDFWSFMKTVAYAFGTVPLALGIAASLTLLHHKNPKYIAFFAPVGKTALSNYLFQTIIAITIFYGIGFGLAGKLGYTVIIVIAIIIFSIQIGLSKLWLHYFRFGPIEWIWRQMTYGKLLKLKKSDKTLS